MTIKPVSPVNVRSKMIQPRTNCNIIIWYGKVLGMLSVTFKSHPVLKDEPDPVRSVCTYIPIPYLDDVVVNICVDSTKPISMASVNDSVNVKHGRISADDINTS